MPLERLHRVCFQNFLQSAVDVVASTHETHLPPPGLKCRGLSASRLQKHLPSYFDSTTPVKGPNCNIKSKNKEKITTNSTSCELCSRPAPVWLHQVELLQVVPQDGVLDGHEDEADVLGVGGAGEVGVQRLVLVRVLLLVHFQDEFLSRVWILLRSCTVGVKPPQNTLAFQPTTSNLSTAWATPGCHSQQIL